MRNGKLKDRHPMHVSESVFMDFSARTDGTPSPAELAVCLENPGGEGVFWL